MSGPRLWLVGYDVRDPRRLRRVRRFLSRRAIPLQYSVFLFRGDTRAARDLGARLARLVRAADDLRIYPLPPGTRLHTYGPGPLPRGVVLVDRDLLRLFRDLDGRRRAW